MVIDQAVSCALSEVESPAYTPVDMRKNHRAEMAHSRARHYPSQFPNPLCTVEVSVAKMPKVYLRVVTI